MRRMLARLRRDDAGLSLSELVISSMLTVLVLTMVAGLFVQTAKLTADASQTNNSNAIASNVTNEISSVLRVATTNLRTGQTVADPAIVSGSRSSITVYSLSTTDPATGDEPAPVKITFALDPLTKGLIETRCTAKKTAGFWTFTTCAATTPPPRDLGIGVDAAQLFTYYDGNDVELVIGSTGFLTDPQRAKVAKIKVQVTALDENSKNDPVTISNTVILGNLGLGTTTS